MEKIPVLKVKVRMDDEKSGIDQISFVESPAMKVEWQLYNENTQKFSTNDDEQIIYYPVIVADTPIYRNEPFEHYVEFGLDEIKIMRNKLFKNNNHNRFNESHGPVKIDAYIVESWIKMDDKDKSVHMGFDVPVGSWFVGIKVDNEDYWTNKVKKGKFKGLSMESFYELDIPTDLVLEQYTKTLLNMGLSDEVLEMAVRDILSKLEK